MLALENLIQAVSRFLNQSISAIYDTNIKGEICH